MPAPPKLTDADLEILSAMRGTIGDDRFFRISKAILDYRHQERLVKHTKTLSVATWVLAAATISLVIATTVLALVTTRN